VNHSFGRRAVGFLLLVCRRGKAAAWIGALVLCVGSASPAAGQDSRREALEQRRAERAEQLEPYEPGKLESALLYLERTRLIERWFGGLDGWYPFAGSITRGGGIAGGAGYRQHVWRNRLRFDTSAAISYKNYRAAEVEVGLPYLADDRVEISTRFRYRLLPQEDYHGIGPDSSRGNRVSYLREDKEAGARIAYRPVPWFETGAELAWMGLEIGAGRDPRYPSIEEVFTEVDAPGLATRPSFMRSGVWASVDYRDQPGNARSGGLYTVAWQDYNDRGSGQYSFGRLDAEARQYFPIWDKKRVIAVRARFNFANNDPGGAVPFYFLPTVGGSDSLRAYRNFRFHDENALVLNAEYRWEAFSGLDMALFFDAGEVRPDWQNIDLRDLNTSYGIGFRFNTYKDVFLRLDVGFGGEGTRYFMAFGPNF
jgi:outer membrane protein assembly factor BamA